MSCKLLIEMERETGTSEASQISSGVLAEESTTTTA